MQLAINFLDLDRNPPLIIGLLLGDKIDKTTPIVMDKSRFDEAGVVFTCDLETAACVCDTIRTKDRNEKRYPTRVYLRRHEAWRKLAGADVLALVEGDKVVLNPKVFG